VARPEGFEPPTFGFEVHGVGYFANWGNTDFTGVGSHFPLRELMQNCSPNLKPIIIVALNTGMRKGEILNLKWDHIDFEVRIIKVVS
jgi:hypothetical protein